MDFESNSIRNIVLCLFGLVGSIRVCYGHSLDTRFKWPGSFNAFFIIVFASIQSVENSNKKLPFQSNSLVLDRFVC